MEVYQYTACGLDNVVVEGAVELPETAGDGSVTIPAIGQLHQVIAEAIVTRPAKMTGQELRFLRTEMGLTQSQLANILKVTLLTVSRWERNENPFSEAAEMLVRLHSARKLQLAVNLDVESVSELVAAAACMREIRIELSRRGQYRLLNGA